MNIKKKILSLAVIAGLTFSCVPQANATAKGCGGGVVLLVTGLTSMFPIACTADWYNEDPTYARAAVLGCVTIGFILANVGIMALFDSHYDSFKR